MLFHKKYFKKIPVLYFLLPALLVFFVCAGFFYRYSLTEDRKFESFAAELFQTELAGNTLNLHYSIAHPEVLGISAAEATLGRISTDPTDLYQQYETYEKKLNQFAYSKLSVKNQLTLDTLLLYCHTQRSLGENYLLEEYLSPGLGIQAQLPILLAEYTFRCQQDIIDYLKLLQDIRPYFQSILEFEKKKSEAGFFMSDETLDRIQEQCQAFIADPDSNYMLHIFIDKISEFSSISTEEKQELISLHEKLLYNEVIPAYQELISGLETLRGTGKNTSGLYYHSGGQDYYQYLLQSLCGIYTTIPKLEYQLTLQLIEDCQELNQLLNEYPNLLTQYMDAQNITILESDPARIMHALLEDFQKDFPAPASTDYEIRSVHPSMEEYLSPAFYLTPPLDTGSPNTIYLNHASLPSSLELFTTLAHEGYPGHLYQTTYFSSQSPLPIRYLLNCGGYTEGWATYVESYAYEYAARHPELNSLESCQQLTKLAYLNRATTLCLYSLMDIGIHYRGWTETETASFLRGFGILDTEAIHEIFLYIVENPANYMKYYGGALKFMELKKACQELSVEQFDLKSFHEQILEIGPVPFPILEKYINIPLS